MSGKEALYKITDIVECAIAALNHINETESVKVTTILGEIHQYFSIVYDELGKGEA